MVEIGFSYEGSLRTRAIHGPSANELLTDAPKDNQGKGESFSPTDLVATALGTCALTIMAMAARREGVELEGARANVTKRMIADPDRRIAGLDVRFDMPAGIPVDKRAAIEDAGLNCPVWKSIHPAIECPTEFVYPD